MEKEDGACYFYVVQAVLSKRRLRIRWAVGVFLALAIPSFVFQSIAGKKHKQTPTEERLVGEWFSGNGMGTIQLTLHKNGKYVARASQCLGVSGAGSGTWDVAHGFLIFHPRNASGDLEEMRLLQITNVNNDIYFLKLDSFSQKSFSDQGPSRPTCFKKDTYW